ncbi:MAG: signal peptide peptidase SppA [Planctomycetes bacterium]|nr:signal peptide peptidase SppA [Planctomycetota bacterium]
MTRLKKHLCWAAAALLLALLTADVAWAGKRVIRLRFDGPVREAPGEEFDPSVIFSGEKARTLHEWVTMINKAAKDDEIHGAIMIVEQPALGFAQIEELTRALKAFHENGKKIYCYLDYAGNGSYALASVADHITLAEYSQLSIAGLRGELSFYKGLFDKIGVYADMMHCGDYKSALEPFTRTEPSPEAAENIDWLLDGIFDRWLHVMAEGRGLSVAEVRAAVDEAPLEAEQALQRKLIDAIAGFPAFKQMIYKEFGKDVEVLKKYGKKKDFELDFENPFAIFQLFSDLMEKAQEEPEPGLGLIYIEGGIVMGKNEASLFGGASAGSTTIRAAFEKARLDKNIKAVVVRVNSPGGSALASDIMWDAATRCAKEKPLIVSMGNVAGSGGYYVAIPGDVIFAEESTITASIGVVGGKFVWKELMEDKLGITTTEFKRGAHAGLMSMNRRWNEAERAWMMGYMNGVYKQFKDRIMQSRGDRLKQDLEGMAGGRVFTGRQALERGLVDKLGGLSDALAYAADKAGLKEYEIYVLPKPKELADIFKMLLGQETEDEWEVGLRAPWVNDPLAQTVLPLVRSLAPEQVDRILGGLRNAVTINREHVGCFMPFDWRVR